MRNTSATNMMNDSSSSLNTKRANSRGFETMTPLPNYFVPTEKTVLLGRGKKILSHSGNQLFKRIVETKLNAYLEAESRIDKTAILMDVIQQVRDNDPGGGFVKRNPKTGQHFEVGDFLAKEKTAQAFRDALHEYYSSSNPSKRKRRVEELANSANNDASWQVNLEYGSNKVSSHTDEQSLVQAIHHTLSAPQTLLSPETPSMRQWHSAPSSPTQKPNLDIQRTLTPPPSFARYVSLDADDENFPTKRKRQSSFLFLEGTFAELSCALVDDIQTLDDPFEPIPLDDVDEKIFDLTQIP